MSVKVLIDVDAGNEVLAISNDTEHLKSVVLATLGKYSGEYDPQDIEDGNWGEYDFKVVEYTLGVKDDVVQVSTARDIREKVESSVDEIERVLVGNKSRDVEEVYLNNAIRYLKELDSALS